MIGGVPIRQGIWYFAWSQTREIQVNLWNPVKFLEKYMKYREICQKYP